MNRRRDVCGKEHVASILRRFRFPENYKAKRIFQVCSFFRNDDDTSKQTNFDFDYSLSIFGYFCFCEKENDYEKTRAYQFVRSIFLFRKVVFPPWNSNCFYLQHEFPWEQA
ncbi:hypothetical protein AVEN_85175-1 [Araneus ventricosus]|uniref:Uncharacterized protein n=1 Tax=Araneus ventricosus TaxID=182803 RepID=A0A4Y2I933_ARAVE|nr:hypothetical protein AVEN_85175-1 [Araneus ventricosus]